MTRSREAQVPVRRPQAGGDTAAAGNRLPSGMSAQGLGMVVKHLVADPTHAGNFHHDPRRAVKALPYLTAADKSALSRAGTDKLRNLADAARQLQRAHGQITRMGSPGIKRQDGASTPASRVLGSWASRGALPQSQVGATNPDRVGSGGAPEGGVISGFEDGSGSFVDQIFGAMNDFGIAPDGGSEGITNVSLPTGGWRGGGGSPRGGSRDNGAGGAQGGPSGGRALDGAPDIGGILGFEGSAGDAGIDGVLSGYNRGGFGPGGAAEYVSSYGTFNPGAEVSGYGGVDFGAVVDLVKGAAAAVFGSGPQPRSMGDLQPDPTVTVQGDTTVVHIPTASEQNSNVPTPKREPGPSERRTQTDREFEDELNDLEAHGRISPDDARRLRTDRYFHGPTWGTGGTPNPEDDSTGGPGGPRYRSSADTSRPSDDGSTTRSRGPGAPRARLEGMPDDTGTGPVVGGPRARAASSERGFGRPDYRPAPDDVGPSNPHARLVSATRGLLEAFAIIGR
jgi:hypothetical protein